MKNKIGVFTLSGLTVGPILGSGILILPPLVYSLLKDWAIVAWLVILLISFIFAYIFGQLAIEFPGDAGVTNAVEKAFGKYYKQLTSFYLLIAVIFGAVAILLTAAQYVAKVVPISAAQVGYLMLIFCFSLLVRKISILGRVVSILSTLSAALLLFGALSTLRTYPEAIVIQSSFSLSTFGYSLLLLFWTILGWEVLGHYSEEVRDAKKNIPRSIALSAGCIALVELAVAAALQWSNTSSFWTEEISISTIMYTIFGTATNLSMAILTALLCCSTYLLYVGGMARLLSSMADEKVLPTFVGKRSKSNVPYVGVIVMVLIHFAAFALVDAGVYDLEKLVAIANAFFLVNVLLGVSAGAFLIKNVFLKIFAALFGVMFLGMLCYFSSKLTLLIIILMAVYYAGRQVCCDHKLI